MSENADPSANPDPVVASTGDETDTTSVGAGDPEQCPVCDVAYDSVSVHDAGLLVNLLDNERYRRVCFEPIAGEDGRPLVRFFHHTHAQAALDG